MLCAIYLTKKQLHSHNDLLWVMQIPISPRPFVECMVILKNNSKTCTWTYPNVYFIARIKVRFKSRVRYRFRVMYGIRG